MRSILSISLLILAVVLSVEAGPCSNLPFTGAGGQHISFNLDALTKIGPFTVNVASNFTIEFTVCGVNLNPCPNTITGISACGNTTASNVAGSCMKWVDRTNAMSSCRGKFVTGGQDAFTTTMMSGNSGVSLIYHGGDVCDGCRDTEPMRTQLNVVCDPSRKAIPFVTVDFFDPASSNVVFSLKHTSGCPITAQKAGKKLSGGSICLIILAVLIPVYFVGGILLNKFAFGKEGSELIPNVGFWSSLPGLVADGVRFIMCRPPAGSSGGDGGYERVHD